VDTDRPSSTGGGGLFHRMSKSDLPVQTPKGTDPQAQERAKDHKQPRKGDRTTRKGAKTPTATSTSNIPPIPATEGIQAQPPRSDTTHEPEGEILGSSSAITGFLKLTNTVPSETYNQKEKFPHSSTTLSSYSNGAKIALTETLETRQQPAAIKIPISAIPSSSVLTAPPPEDKRGMSRGTLAGAKGPTEDTIIPPTHDSVDTDRPPSTGDEELFLREKMNESDPPGQTPKGMDSQPQELGQDHKQPRKGDRTTRKGAKTPIATSASNTPPIPMTDGKQSQPSRFDTIHAPDGLISDSSSTITGLFEFTSTVPSETHKRKEKDSTAKCLAHSITTLTTPSSHSDGAEIVPIETLEIGKQPAATITDRAGIVNMEQEPSLTNAQIASINKIKRRQARAKGQSKTGTACFASYRQAQRGLSPSPSRYKPHTRKQGWPRHRTRSSACREKWTANWTRTPRGRRGRKCVNSSNGSDPSRTYHARMANSIGGL